MADDLYKNRTEKDEKVTSQTIQNSIHKCADAAVSWGKINQDISNLRRAKIAPELIRIINNCLLKQRTIQKVGLGMISKQTIKDISETKSTNLKDTSLH